MPTSCVAGGCTRNSSKNPEIRFVQFPRDPAISKEWVKFVNNTRKDFTFSARSRPLICSAHFSEDCIEPSINSSALKKSLGLTTKFRLKPGSIPTKAPNIERIRVSTCTTTRLTATTSAESSASAAGSAVAAESGAESQKGLLKRNVGGFTGTAFQKRETEKPEST